MLRSTVKFFAIGSCIFFFATISLAATPPKLENVFNGEGCESDHLFQQSYKPSIAALAQDVQRILDHVLVNQSGTTYESLAYFVDKFGPRFTGTLNLEKSIDFMLKWLAKEGHQNVHGEEVTVPKWVRGKEYVAMVKPRFHKMNILGLGYSEGTGNETLEAPVIVVRSFEELEKRSNEVAGKIVVYNYNFESYGKSVKYRSQGASKASKYGAVAALIRSVTPFSINSPHTGMQTYRGNVTKIPAISITVEDAEMLQRFSDRKVNVVVRIFSQNHLESESAISRNTVSELVGSTYPNQVVLVSGHLDSWDVGQGAMDDGAGAFISWRALSVVRSLGLRPKRTMRSVLWTAEEMGLIGAQAYADKHASQSKDLIIAMESDIGTFTPLGLTYSGTNKTAQCIMWEIMKLMAPINATTLSLSKEGSDVEVFLDKGVPISSLATQNDKYFYFHHTNGDTMTVESRADLDKCTALWTSVAYALASLDSPLPR